MSAPTADQQPTPRTYFVNLRHDRGKATITVNDAVSARQAVRTVLATEHAPLRSVQWVRQWPICDYCDQSATRYVKDSADNTPLCTAHAKEHYGREVEKCTGKLGITRLIVLDPADWAPAEDSGSVEADRQVRA